MKNKMIIDCIADLHGHKPNLEGGDLLILAGDYTETNKISQWAQFFKWLKNQSYRKKILIAGNHDGFFATGFPQNQKEADDLKEVQSFLKEEGEMGDPEFEYLCDSGTEFEGLKIWGTPWTPWFSGVNPNCKYFMKSESFILKKLKLIPNGIDILISHGPMKGILDINLYGESCGSISLKNEINRVNPTYFIFGHIHENGGEEAIYLHKKKGTICINCSYVDEFYKPNKKICRITTNNADKI